MTRDRGPKVSYRMPQERLDAIDALAEQFNVSRSALLRRFDAFGLESNAEALGVEAEIAKLKSEIIEFGKPIDDAGGFAGRVRDDFEKRFKNGYEPKWLAAKAESYRREARMLEEKVSEHPDAPPIEEGELEAEVDRVLRDTLEAAKLSDWNERYRNPFERLSGVESGKKSRRLALALTRSAVEMDADLEPLRSSLSSERRVQADDLPELADEDLPEGVDREDVARVARELADRGVPADEIEVDPTEFDPFGWTEEVDAEVVDGTTDALPDPEADGGTESVVADWGDNEAIQVYNQADDGDDEQDEQSDEHTDADTEHMDRSTPNPTPDRSEIVEGLTDLYDRLGGGAKAEKMLFATLTDAASADEHGYQEAVEKNDYDPEAIVEEAIVAAGDGESGDVEVGA